MHKSSLSSRTVLLTLVGMLLLFPALASSYHGGIGGPQSHQGSTGQVDIDDVAKSGCLCHNEVADNAVQVILDDVPYAWVAGETYTLQLQLIGGPPATGTYTAGFSMRVSLGTLSSDMAQNWEIDGTVDEQTLPHTEASAATEARAWRRGTPKATSSSSSSREGSPHTALRVCRCARTHTKCLCPLSRVTVQLLYTKPHSYYERLS